jgi:hypothetical protein
MIFPPVRISQLSRERAEREAEFQRSRAALLSTVKDAARPGNLVRRHPGLLAGAAMSAISMLGLRKMGHRNGVLNGRTGDGTPANWLLKILAFGGGIAFKSLRPFAFTAVRYVVRSAFRTLRGR